MKTLGLLAEIQKYIPQAQIAYKNESRFMRFLGAIMFFNPTFMTDYVTTIGYTSYFPSREYVQNNDDGMMMILSHEFVHMYDYQRRGFLFKFLYLLPQLGAVFSLLSLIAIGASKWWLLSLLFLLLALPLPAYWRMASELRGYTMTLAVRYWTTGWFGSPEDYIDDFTGGGYYWMWPFPANIKMKLLLANGSIFNKKILGDIPYAIVFNWLKTNNLVSPSVP